MTFLFRLKRLTQRLPISKRSNCHIIKLFIFTEFERFKRIPYFPHCTAYKPGDNPPKRFQPFAAFHTITRLRADLNLWPDIHTGGTLQNPPPATETPATADTQKVLMQ